MERPKSAKYNIERYKSSISYSSSNSSNRKNANRTAAKQAPQLPNRDEYLDINKNDLSLVTPSPAQFIIDDDDDDDRVYSNAKQKRLQTSKSAYVAGSLRPQSAKHDLEKYRQDVLLERKKKLEKLNQSNNNNNAGESTITNDKNSTTVPADDDENDFQNLGNVIIRDDVDSSDDDDKSADEADEYLLIDNQPSYKNNNQLKDANNKNNSSKTNNNPTTNKSSKLLNKRNTGAVVGNGRQATSNLPNKAASLNHYTTFRPTAVTTNYSTSLPNDDEDPASILVNQHQQSLPGNNKQTVTSMSDYGTSKPTNVANLNNKIIKLHSVNKQLQHTTNGAHDVTNAGLDGSNNTTVTTTITHSSSSTSSTSSSKARSRAPVPAEQQPPPPLPLPPTDESIHLTYELNINRKKNTSNIELTSKELLKEWFRKDEEFDMLIDDYNFQKNLPPQQPANNRNHVNNPNPNNGGNNSNSNSRTTTRLSDYSSNTTLVNKNSNTTTNNNTAAKIVPIRINRDKSNLMDPWAKRNPSLIAQNVLSKHRAELEQLAASRNLNNNSQTSNASNIALPNMNKFLLPDSSKYYKK